MAHEMKYVKDKGKRNGSCNRRDCLAPGADHYNLGSLAWYCEPCAHDINNCNKGLPDVQRGFPNGLLCHTAEKLEELYEDACCERGCERDYLQSAKESFDESEKQVKKAEDRMRQAGLPIPE